MQAINFEQNCAPHWGRAQGKDGRNTARTTGIRPGRPEYGPDGRNTALTAGIRLEHSLSCNIFKNLVVFSKKMVDY
jgi:hypothetical protein